MAIVIVFRELINKNMSTYQSIKEATEKHQARILLLSVIIVLSTGTIFYHIVEKWTWLNSLYFCVITLATIGYGDFTPTKDISKIFTMGYVFVGIAIIFGFINYLARRGAIRLKKHKPRQIEK